MKWNDFVTRWLLVSLHNAIFTLQCNRRTVQHPKNIVVVKFQELLNSFNFKLYIFCSKDFFCVW